jgi:hypothetical protein
VSSSSIVVGEVGEGGGVGSGVGEMRRRGPAVVCAGATSVTHWRVLSVCNGVRDLCTVRSCWRTGASYSGSSCSSIEGRLFWGPY